MEDSGRVKTSNANAKFFRITINCALSFKVKFKHKSNEEMKIFITILAVPGHALLWLTLVK